MTDLQYRVATAQDIPAIVELVNSAYRGESSKKGWTTEADLLDGQRTDAAAIADLLAQPDTVFLLCHSREGLLGSVHLEKEDQNCYLGMFTVRPDLQGHGVGKKFIQAAEEFAVKTWQSKTVSMTVIIQRTELIAWYKRRGYKPTGDLVPFPYGDERFGIPKRPDLKMTVLRKTL